MKAGAELDQAIAERVMGWHARGFDGKWHDWYDGHEFVIGWSRWKPSSDIVNAWQVVQKLTEMGLGVEILSNPGHGRVRINYGESASAVGAASEIPLLICLAALAALRATEGK